MIALIAGILRLDGKPAETDQVAAMLDEMHFDGLPGSKTITTDGPFAAGVLHVSPKGSPTPSQPQVISEAGVTLAADLALYDQSGDPLSYLMQLLRQHGPMAAQHLHGDFALAAWDGKVLRLTRDHFGIRPMQYTVRPGVYVAFASLPNALLGTGLSERILDAQTLKTYPIAGMAIGPRTYFSGVNSVQAAHNVTFDRQGATSSERYWSLPLGPLLDATTNPDALAGELLELLNRAVRRRLPEDGPVAGHLSGGLDSGAISAIAATSIAKQNRRFHAFCLAEHRGEPGLSIVDELPYAQAVADAAPNIALNTIPTPDQIDLMHAIDPDLFLSIHPDEPEEQALRTAAAQGATTVLSGWGGDEVVTWRGHGNLVELLLAGQLRAMLQAVSKMSRDSGSPALTILRRAFLNECLPDWIRDLIRRRRGAKTTGWVEDILNLVPPDSRRAIKAVPQRQSFVDSRRQRLDALGHWSLAGRLEVFAQRGARHGIRYAYPMLDLDLLAFAVRIPAALLKEDGRNRAVFRRAMQGILPDEVRLKNRKLTPYPAETLRQSRRKPHMLREIDRMQADPLIRRFINSEGLKDYIATIRDPDEVLAWMNELAADGKQVVQHELYHVFVVWLAWYLDQYGNEAQ